MKINLFFPILFVFMTAVSCTSANMKLTKQEVTSYSRIVFGKIIDLNPDSKPSELQVTYVLSDKNKAAGMLTFGNKFPNLEPKGDFFWISIPQDITYFGITSIRFGLNGVDGTAIIRDDKTQQPLFGTHLTKGTEPVYIGEIVIRSGTRKYGASKIIAEGFDLKEINIKNNAQMAKDILNKNGIDSTKLITSPLKINNI